MPLTITQGVITGTGEEVIQVVALTEESVVVVATNETTVLELGVEGPQGPPGEGVDDMYALELDDVGGGVTYVGQADPGTASSASTWRIKRITESGDDIAVDWADGTAAFTKEWDERLTYSYS